MWYVNVYEVRRAYGGPEEGGWWFDVGEVVRILHFRSRSGAVAAQTRLKAEYALPYLGSQSVNVCLERNPGQSYPETRPHYE